MRIHSLKLVNFGPFRSLEDFRFDSVSTIIGQNDTGKSHIIHALEIFLKDESIEIGNVYNGANLGENVIIEVAFDSFPDHIELEEGSQSTLKSENLLDANGYLRMGVVYPVPGKGLPIYEYV